MSAKAKRVPKSNDISVATDWFFEGEVGTSSETMCRAFLGREKGQHDGTPSDCDDLARCRLFLDRLSDAGRLEALKAVASRYTEWIPLVREWAAVCKSMDEECPAWRSEGSRWGEQTTTLIGVLNVEGLRLRYPKAKIETYADGTLSSMFNPGGPTEVTLRAEDFGPQKKKRKRA